QLVLLVHVVEHVVVLGDRVVLAGHLDADAGLGDAQPRPHRAEGVVLGPMGPQQPPERERRVDGGGGRRGLPPTNRPLAAPPDGSTAAARAGTPRRRCRRPTGSPPGAPPARGPGRR